MQFLEIEGQELRHIVSSIYTFETYEEALACKEEYSIRSNTDIVSGNIVHLLDKLRLPVLDREGNPCQYQVVAVYQETMKVGLVTSYGEYIGVHDIANILYVSSGPMFVKEDYEVNTSVLWIDGEEVYEGTIDILHEMTATIVNVKKLFPVDYKVRIPYWKIPEGRKSNKESTTQIIHTIIGDDLD